LTHRLNFQFSPFQKFLHKCDKFAWKYNCNCWIVLNLQMKFIWCWFMLGLQRANYLIKLFSFTARLVAPKTLYGLIVNNEFTFINLPCRQSKKVIILHVNTNFTSTIKKPAQLPRKLKTRTALDTFYGSKKRCWIYNRNEIKVQDVK
jgi:hypothetical protein